MKKLVTAAIVLVLSFASFAFSSADNEGKFAKILDDGTKMRKTASESSSIITSLKAGTFVTVLETITESKIEWYKIEVEGNVGFVLSARASIPVAAEAAPTPSTGSSVLDITAVTLFSEYGYRKLDVSVYNNTNRWIDAFDVIAQAYNNYNEILGWYSDSRKPSAVFTFSNAGLSPWSSFDMHDHGNSWDLFGWDTATKIEVAIYRYHIKDGETVTISPDEYVWVEGKLK